MREGGRLGEQLESQPVAGVVGVEQISSERHESPPLIGVHVAGAEVLFAQLSGYGMSECSRVGHDADLAAAEIACDVQHLGKLRACQYAACVEQCLDRNQ